MLVTAVIVHFPSILGDENKAKPKAKKFDRTFDLICQRRGIYGFRNVCQHLKVMYDVRYRLSMKQKKMQRAREKLALNSSTSLAVVNVIYKRVYT